MSPINLDRLLYVIFLCVYINESDCVVPYNDVKSDYETLLSAYRMPDSASIAEVVPKDLTSGPLTLYLGISLYAIMDYDGVSGRIQLIASMKMEWLDEVKAISGTTFQESLQTLFVAHDQIWTPNIVLMSAVDSVERIGDESYRVRYNVSSGYCKWYPRMIINAACTPDMTYYPFDKQTCVLTVTPWNRDSSALKLVPLTNEWNSDNLEKSGIWDVSETSSEAYISSNNSRYHIDFEITIKRKPFFLALVIVLPVLLLSLLTGFLFLLPPGSGERVGFGITCFLSFVVLLQTLMSFMPEVSSPMSILCFYVIVMLSFSVILSIANVFLLRMYLNPSKEDLPRFFLIAIEVITCKVWRRCPKCPKIKLKCPKINLRCLKRRRSGDTVHNIRFARRLTKVNETSVSEDTDSTEHDSGFYIGDDDDAFERKSITSMSDYQENGKNDFQLVRRTFSAKSSSVLTTSSEERIDIDLKQLSNLNQVHCAPVHAPLSINGTSFTTGHIEGKVDSNQASEMNQLESAPVHTSLSATRIPSTIDYSEEILKVEQASEMNRSNSVIPFTSLSAIMTPANIDFSEENLKLDQVSETNQSGSTPALSSYDTNRTVRFQSASPSRESTSMPEKNEITWEYLAQVLDLFFIVVFCVVQTVFTIFYLVPLGAQY